MRQLSSPLMFVIVTLIGVSPIYPITIAVVKAIESDVNGLLPFVYLCALGLIGIGYSTGVAYWLWRITIRPSNSKPTT